MTLLPLLDVARSGLLAQEFGLSVIGNALRMPGADVGARLTGLAAVQSSTADETARRSRLEDADVVVSELAQVQQALQTLLAAIGRTNGTDPTSLLGA